MILSSLSSTKIIHCLYEVVHYDASGTMYRCEVSNVVNITSPETAVIESVNGTHNFLKHDNDVKAFKANSKSITYFPRQLQKFFKNLKAITIWHGRIREICQLDIKMFPELVEFNLHENDIVALPRDLFDFNPKMKYISFSDNKIVYIEDGIFDKLPNVRFLYLNKNICIQMDGENSNDVKEVIKKIKPLCSKSICPAMTQSESTTITIIKVTNAISENHVQIKCTKIIEDENRNNSPGLIENSNQKNVESGLEARNETVNLYQIAFIITGINTLIQVVVIIIAYTRI